MTGQQLSQATIGKANFQHYHKFDCGNGQYAFLPLKLKEDIDIFIDDMMYEEMDIVFCIDGKEGTGKSRDSRIIGKYISSITGVPFGPKNIHLTTEDYIKSAEEAVTNKIKFQINVLDESRQALNKKRGMSKSNVGFSNYMSECRDSQQAHILLLPAIHDLENYITMWRMSLLIHKIKAHKKNKKRRSGYSLMRGYFKVYENSKHLQQVIFNKAKYGYYAYPNIYKYRRKMLNTEPFTEKELKEYKNKKAEKRKEKYTEQENKKPKTEINAMDSTNKLISKMKDEGKTWGQIGDILGCGASAAQMKYQRYEDALKSHTT